MALGLPFSISGLLEQYASAEAEGA